MDSSGIAPATTACRAADYVQRTQTETGTGTAFGGQCDPDNHEGLTVEQVRFLEQHLLRKVDINTGAITWVIRSAAWSRKAYGGRGCVVWSEIELVLLAVAPTPRPSEQ